MHSAAQPALLTGGERDEVKPCCCLRWAGTAARLLFFPPKPACPGQHRFLRPWPVGTQLAGLGCAARARERCAGGAGTLLSCASAVPLGEMLSLVLTRSSRAFAAVAAASGPCGACGPAVAVLLSGVPGQRAFASRLRGAGWRGRAPAPPAGGR